MREFKKAYDALIKKKNLTGQDAINAVKENSYVLKYCLNPSEELMKIAVAKDGCALKYCLNPSEELMKIAVAKDGCALKYCLNPSEEVCKIAVAKDGYALQYVPSHYFEPKEITMQEIADKFGMDINDLKIKK
jgi:hypothetical protein